MTSVIRGAALLASLLTTACAAVQDRPPIACFGACGEPQPLPTPEPTAQ